MSERGEFALVRSSGPAAALHERALPVEPAPAIWWHDVTSPALILGSAQDASVFDPDACRNAGVDVVRRRSGGGAVLLIPAEVVWFDVIVPADLLADVPGVASDVRASMVWLGRHLRQVLGIGIVHEDGLVTTRWSRIICFDGIGPGELSVDGAKVVGISQRRTRTAARFQVCWHTAYDPMALVALMHEERRPPVGELRPVATLDAPAANTAAILEHLRARLTAENTSH